MHCAALQHCNQGLAWPGGWVVRGQRLLSLGPGLGDGAGAAVKQVALILSPLLTGGRAC